MIHPFWLPLVLRDPSGAGRSWEQRRGQTPPPPFPPCSVDCMHASGGFCCMQTLSEDVTVALIGGEK